MNRILIAAVLLGTAFIGYKAYEYFTSATNLEIEIVDADLINFNFTVRFMNVGSSPVSVNAVTNQIFANGDKVGSASNLKGFTINSRSQKDVKFDITSGLIGGTNILLGLIKNGRNKPKITIETAINVKGTIIKKITEL
jgi:LEA14-like dessication related protein